MSAVVSVHTWGLMPPSNPFGPESARTTAPAAGRPSGPRTTPSKYVARSSAITSPFSPTGWCVTNTGANPSFVNRTCTVRW